MLPASPVLRKSIGSGGAFTPADMSTAIAWYDAMDSATITESDGVVSAWADKIGANDLTAVGAPTILDPSPGSNNLPGIGSFSTTNADGFIMPAPVAITHIYMVLFQGPTATFNRYETLISGTGEFGAPRVMGNVGTTNLIASSAFASQVSINGGANTSTILPLSFSVCRFVGSATDQFSIGYGYGASQRTWFGRYSDIVFCNGAPAAQEETDLLNYFYAKWGITP